MDWLMTIAGIVMALAVIGGVLVGVGWIVLQCVLFVKALIDRLSSKEDSYYSKNIHQ